MKKYEEKIYNIETYETTYRDWTPEEIAEAKAMQALIQIAEVEQAKKLTARKAVFEKLGLTEEDLQKLGL